MSHSGVTPATVIGFDWGTQKIGVAVGQGITATAQPLDPIKSNDGVPNWDTVAALFNEWQPDAVIVGYPTHMDNSASETSVRAKKFANRIHGRFGLPVHLMDERLTSFEARQLLDEQAQDRNWPKRFKQKGYLDSVAAALIVESWYQEQQQADGTLE